MGMDPNTLGIVTGALIGGAMAHGQKGVSAPQQAATPAPQPTHAPDAGMILQNMQADAAHQPSTFLTGPQGVDPKKVKTVHPTLYGGG